jgi:uncharacterized protein (DUF58 family)
MLKTRLTYAGLLAGLFILWVYCNNYASFTLLIAAVVFPLLSLIIMAAGIRRLTLESILPEYLSKAEEIQFEIRITNRAFVPIARAEFTVQMQNSLTLAQTTQKLNVSMHARSSESYQMNIAPVYAGLLNIEVTEVEYYDCFGLFRYRQRVKQGKTTRINAHLREVPAVFEEMFGVADDSERYSEFRPGNDVSEVFDTREYVIGDEIKKINWKMSSKYDQIIVRDFSLPQSALLTIMLELSKGQASVTDLAVELFLSLSESLIEAGVIHNMAWYDAGNETFQHIEISDLMSFEIAQMKLLESYGYEEAGTALSYYMENLYHRNNNTVLYMAAAAEESLIAEASMQQPVIWLQPENELGELLEL